MSTLIVLVCAVLASLATGVLIAYAVFLATFGFLKMHARQIRPEGNIPISVSAAQS